MKKLIIILVIILGYLSYDTIKTLPKQYNLNSEIINNIKIEIQKIDNNINIDTIPDNTIIIYERANKIGILPNRNILETVFNNDLEALNTINSISVNSANSVDEALFECKNRIKSYLENHKGNLE